MRVVATKMGYFGGVRRKVGATFEVPDGTSAKWFAPVATAEVKPTKVSTPKGAKANDPKGAKANDPKTFSEIAKKDGEDQKPRGADDLV